MIWKMSKKMAAKLPTEILDTVHQKYDDVKCDLKKVLPNDSRELALSCVCGKLISPSKPSQKAGQRALMIFTVNCNPYQAAHLFYFYWTIRMPSFIL